MTRRLAALTAALSLSVLAAACTSTTGATVNTHAATTGTAASRHAAAATHTPAAPAHVGSTIDITGQQAGDVMAVTLVKVAAAAASPNPQVDTPQPGNRYYAAQFRLTNHGRQPYDDAPDNAAKVIDAQGQQYDATIVSAVTAGPLFPAEVKISPGGSALGWVVFEVPARARITAAQFSLSSGFGNAGQWIIP